MADETMQRIYNRIKDAGGYHPMQANTFADWALEAGDVINVSRDGKSYSAPVHTSTVRWNGKQEVEIDTTGKKERDTIAKTSQKKFGGRGAGGIRNLQPLFHEVYDTEGRVSRLQNTALGLYHEVYDTDGKFSKLQNTANGLYHEVYDTAGRFSKLQNTANGLYHEVYDTTGRMSRLQNTANGLYHEVYDTTGRMSRLQNTANGLYHEVYDTAGRLSRLQNTANGLYHEIYDTAGRMSRLQNTVNGLYHEVYDTAGRLSRLQNTAKGLYHEVYDTNGKFSKLQNTANGLYHEVYDTNGKFSKLQNTAEGLRHEVYDTNGRFSMLQNTAEGLRHEVYDTNGRFSKLENTAKGLLHEVYDTNGKFSTLQNTAEGLRHEVYDPGGKMSTVENTVNGFTAKLSGVVDNQGNVTAASIATKINEQGQAGVKIDGAWIKIGNKTATTVIDGILSAGYITADDITATLIKSKIQLIQNMVANDIQAANVEADVVKIKPVAGMTAINVASAYNAATLTRSGNTYTLQLVKMNGNTTELTFSRATSLSGAWSSGVYTVTASPQNETFSIGYGTSYGSHNLDLEVTTSGLASKDTQVANAIKHNVVVRSLNSGQTQPTTRYTKEITVSVNNLLQAKTGDNKVTSNGTVTPDEGYIGLSAVEVSVSTSHSPTIDNVWTSQSVPSGAQLLNSLKTQYEAAKEDGDNFCVRVKCGSTTKTYYCTP